MIEKRAAWGNPLLFGLSLFLCTTLFATACAGAGATPEMRRVQGKVREVQQELRAWKQAGRNPSAAAAEMQQAKGYLDQKDFGAAEGHIDRALAILREEEVPSAPKTAGTTSSGSTSGTTRRASRSGGSKTSFSKVRISGEPTPNGIYDPAVAYNEAGTVGWLTYTAIDGDQPSKAHFLHTHVAKTADHGKTWRYANTVNKSFRGKGKFKGKTLDGYWHYEVSTMVHDPTDRGREWKMLSFKIFHADKQGRMPQLAWITLKTASDPAGTWSKEESLIASGMLPAQAGEEPRIKLKGLNRALSSYPVYSEPGAVVVDGVLYLSLSALGKGGTDKIVLLRSRDHLKSVEYVGVLASREDAKRLGNGGLDGSALYVKDGEVYMLACAIRSQNNPKLMNDGTYLFAVEDITRAKLRRESDGTLQVLERIHLQKLNSGNHGGGQAGYHAANTGGGIVMPQINLGAMPEWGQVFNTGVVPD